MATVLVAPTIDSTARAPREIELPAPTAWPIVLAAGFTLMFAGLLTAVSVTILGAILTVAACAGWFRDVLPEEHKVQVLVGDDEPGVTTGRPVVERIPVAADQVRVWLPLHTYPISAGIKGGLAGGVAMALLACTYGLLKTWSIWYPINLLAAVIYAESVRLDPASLFVFHADSFVIALALHGLGSMLIGLLYGAMLPMIPQRPILLGGLAAPAFWSGLLYAVLGLVNPLLASRIDWWWFIASQVAFGVVAGLVVVRQARIPTLENVSFALRAGIEAPGLMPPRRHEERRT